MMQKLIPELIDAYPVAAGDTIRQGMTVKIVSGNAEETTSTDSEGIALDPADGDDPRRNSVRVHRYGAGIVPVLCSASLSASQPVKPDTDGVSAITVGGVTTVGQCIGWLKEAGVAGGLAGCDVGNHTLTMA